MSYSATVFNVMIASPGDVDKEREIARRVIYKWNSLHTEDKQIVLLPIGWDTHASPEMGNHPQKIIDDQVLDQTDLLVGVFLHRLGTPTLDAQSGTAHEIQEHVDAGKPAMIYFLEESVNPSEFDKDQYDKLMDFKKDLMSQGLLHECKRADFEDNFSDHLTIKINKNEYIRDNRILYFNRLNVDFDQETKISTEAKELLVEASNDPHGHIVKIRMRSGLEIQTNGKNLVTDNSQRVVAKWEYVLKELMDAGLIEEKGEKGDDFAVTHLGYQYADKFKNEVTDQDDPEKAGGFNEYELAVIAYLAYSDDAEVEAIKRHLMIRRGADRIDSDAAIASLNQSKMIVQSKTNPIAFKLRPEGSIWASKNKHLWQEDVK